MFHFQDSSKVFITGQNYSDNESIRTMECIADGNPSSNRYYKWEHSYNGEHIRNLTGYDNGTLMLPYIENRERRHEDSGFYRCLVGNKVSVNGKINESVQTAGIFIQTTGRPVFLRRNKKTHYGQYGDSINIQFYIYSIPEVRRISNIQPTLGKNHFNIKLDEKKRVADTFHNITVNVLAYVATFSTSVIDSDEYFTNYTIQAISKEDLNAGNDIFKTYIKYYNPTDANSNTGQEEGSVAFNNIYDMYENQQPTVPGAAAASEVYSNFRSDEVLMTDGLACGPLTSQKKPVHQQPVNEELSELSYIEIEVNHIPEGHKFYIHGQENKTEYSEIEFGVIGDPLPSSESELDDDDDNDTDIIDCMVVKD
ncbi:unnamed protein product [Mytilus coruscus]|uniref:Ig-like domain-containing protein n=1 Tax=Mytilus coruscus TaxID=42192 RepID=A0A6J8E917_MYTCO|nr:unnamed protein product [Mytilus coruscus]